MEGTTSTPTTTTATIAGHTLADASTVFDATTATMAPVGLGPPLDVVAAPTVTSAGTATFVYAWPNASSQPSTGRLLSPPGIAASELAAAAYPLSWSPGDSGAFVTKQNTQMSSVAGSNTFGMSSNAVERTNQETRRTHDSRTDLCGNLHAVNWSETAIPDVMRTGAGLVMTLAGQAVTTIGYPNADGRRHFVAGPPASNHFGPTSTQFTMQSPITSTMVHPSLANAHGGPVPSFNYALQSEFELSSTQIAARHVLTKDLPTFAGNPEDWPLFISNFEQSTERCGFSNQENLIRLQKCLKGRALEAVRGRLMVASMVPQAIETLRMLYGRPDVIHQALQRRLRQEPAVKSEKLDTLIRFALAVQNYRATLEAIGYWNYLNDPVLLNDLVRKLPSELKLDWGRRCLACAHINISTFDNWLFSLAACANQVTPFGLMSADQEEVKPPRARDRMLVHQLEENPTTNSARCPKCCDDHRLEDCRRFLMLTQQERFKFVRDSKLCLCCFQNHFVRRCPSKRKCGVDGCAMPHNPLLHDSKSVTSRTTIIKAASRNTRTNEPSVLLHANKEPKTLFRYIPVTLYGKNKCVTTLALIDEGSSCTLLEDDIAAELELEGPTKELCLHWTGDVVHSETQSRILNLEISSQEPASTKFALTNVRTVTNLKLPKQSLDKSTVAELVDTKKIPVTPYGLARAKILIGLDNAKISVPMEMHELEGGSLIAARCKIGWSIYGRASMGHHSRQQVTHICPCNMDDRIDSMVKQYFAIDSIGIRVAENPLRSKADEKAVAIMKATVKYIPEEKRWEAGLLWKYNHISLPDSLPMAQRRLHCLEAKMARDPALKKFLVEKIKDHEEKGYVQKLSNDEVSFGGKSWFLPIFTVTKVNKGKTRLVWDAAAKVNGTALNTMLLKGPDFLKSLVGVLLRFREKPVAISGDIREMFHQVRVIQQDQPAQQFLWREGDVSRKPDVYVMKVMTFGASCSPALANYVKNENARRFAGSYPEAVEAIVNNTYVDDWLQSGDTEEQMMQLVSLVRSIHADGGFEMRNWISNSKRVLQFLAGHTQQDDRCFAEPDATQEKVLGMWWIPSTDELTFLAKFDSSVFDETTFPTKRQILRVVMTIFDPLGLLGFYVIYAKIILQYVWRSGIGWDEQLKDQDREMWWTWTRRLRSINNVRIARCFPQVGGGLCAQLHVFVDASENAYAAVAYLRASDGNVARCQLLASKTRVAPLRPVSIPRLELMAAVLGLRLAKFVEAELTLKLQQRIFWTDSKNVLYWIRSDARKFHQFVALRLGEILEESHTKEWRWVPSALNVADGATKWNKSQDFTAGSVWFSGPKFLQSPESEWPGPQLPSPEDPDDETVHHVELRAETPSFLAVISPDPTRFSKWEKLRNTQRYVLKYLQKLCKRNDAFAGSLFRTDTIEAVELVLIRRCQEETYPDEIKCLHTQKPIQRDSSIFKLSPYLDEHGLLRVKGRIDASSVADSVKRPIILPRNHTISNLLVDFYHRRFHHHHNEIVVNELRQRFVIPSLRALVRAVAKNCQLCRNRNAVPRPPEMGALPAERLAAFVRPFTFTGVDYFGPIDVIVGRHREKRYGVLFTCLTIRAIHIEIAPSLSTDSFLMVFNQFICRRGVPARVLSDNGTNFRGASRVLVDEIEKISEVAVEEKYPHIEWKFIPPAAPHMGGAWERMVRSVKSILSEVLPEHGLREDALRSLMADIENIINSRPLTYVPLDSDQSEALTPNHFLLGSSNGTRIKSSEDDASGLTLGRNFRIASQIADKFWRRWVREYLPTLTRRTKWFQPAPQPIMVGDIVVIVDENAKRNCWKKALVIDLHPGKDGQVRSAVVKTTNGLFTRPIAKLAKLEVKR